MRAVWCVAFIIVAGLFAQVSDEVRISTDLTSSLLSLQDSSPEAADALIARILAIPEAMHQPRHSTLAMFAGELAGSLRGRELKRATAAQMAAAITCALRSAGMGASTFKAHISRFEGTLADAGVNAFAVRALASRLREAGEEVRGPQDLPLIRN